MAATVDVLWGPDVFLCSPNRITRTLIFLWHADGGHGGHDRLLQHRGQRRRGALRAQPCQRYGAAHGGLRLHCEAWSSHVCAGEEGFKVFLHSGAAALVQVHFLLHPSHLGAAKRWKSSKRSCKALLVRKAFIGQDLHDKHRRRRVRVNATLPL
jgi:hypothetical protein